MGIKRLDSKGMTIIELLVAVGIMSALASSVMLARQYMAKQTQKTSDKVFATQKAIQMFEELRALSSQGGQTGFLTLDNYNNGSNYVDILTTDTNVTSPSDPLSANKNIGYWKFWRNVQVLHVTQDPFARIVTVRVYGGLSGNTADTGNLLAEVGGILRINYTPIPPTQVYDVYALGLSNELGWFTSVPNMLSAFEGAVNAVTLINPGLSIREHEISQTAFGRDFFYNPYINVAQNTIQQPMPYCYFYTGSTVATSNGNQAIGAPETFFSSSQLEAVGGINVDGTIKNDNGYSMCDMYNTAMRYPDELAAYAAVSQAAANNPSGSSAYQITLRMLLEEMCSQPASILNPLVISMHGEVLPLVNMRNYSDAAKDPFNVSGSGGPNVRVVTHPDLIHYPSNPSLATSHPVSLLVYGYYDGLLNPANMPVSYPMSPNIPVAPMITLYFPTLELKTTDLTITAISGGVTGGTNVPYYPNVISSGSANATMGMYWTIGNPLGTDTAVTLFNTPLRCGSVTTTGASPVTTGLDPINMLYNTEYIPCSVNTAQNYSTNLAFQWKTSTDGPLNTARWIISFKKANGVVVPDGQYAVETRLGGYPLMVAGVPVTAGNYPPYPQPVPSAGSAAYTLMSDLSRTYLWIGKGSNSGVTWGGSGITPFTECYQYNGDPRDCPYLDCKFGSVAMGTTEITAGGVTIDPASYNWYFTPVGVSGDGYAGFTNTQSGFQGNPTGEAAGITFGDIRDMPRYYYTYRQAVMKSNAVYTNLNGWTAWHASEGGEVGGTYDPYQNSVSFNTIPWDPTHAASNQYIDEDQDSNNWNPAAFTGNAKHTTCRDVMYNNNEATGPTTVWYAKPWVGEMYPDSSIGTPVTNYAVTWMAVGNLPTIQFWRVPFSEITSAGTTNGFDNSNSRQFQWGVGSRGPAALMNGLAVGSGGSTWSLASDGGAAGVDDESDITQLGLNIYNTTNLVMGSPVSAANTRPWNCYYDINATNGGIQDKLPPNWGTAASYYGGLRTTLSVPSVPASINSNNYSRIVYTSEDTAQTGDLNSSPVTWNTLGVIEMDYGAGANKMAGYFNLSGLAPQGSSGAVPLAQTGINTMLRTYLDAGVIHPSGTSGHIPQLPLFQISTGNPANQFSNPSAVTLSWSSPVTWPGGTPVTATLWTRWAGIDNAANWYTEEYPNYSAGAPVTSSTYVEPVTIFYVPMYSANGGTSWISCIDDTTGLTEGNYNAPAANSTTQMAVTWNVSNGSGQFPQQTYSVRVEGYRQSYPLHYSFHEVDDISFTR